MPRLPLPRRVLKAFHPEGIPGVAAHLYNAVSQTAAFQRNYDLVAQDILNYCGSGTILDIGTGPTWLLVAIHRRSPGLKLLGVDISTSMVQIARANLLRSGLGDAVQVLSTDARNLTFEDERFDAVVSSGSFHHWKEPQAGLSEIYRVLKPRGYALIYDIVSDTPKNVLQENALELGRLQTLLLWLHSYEEPFYSQKALQDLASVSPFEEGVTKFVGVLCCLTMQKGSGGLNGHEKIGLN